MITFCIPSKNNLRYLKTAVRSILENSYYKTNEILVYVDKDEDGTADWLTEKGIRHILNLNEECSGIGWAYDTMFELSNTDLVVAFHADMLLGKNADLNMLKHHTRKSVVCSTRIEPPLHPPGPEKIVLDLGMWPEEIKWKEFNAFVEETSKNNQGKTSGSSFAPWLIDRRDHLGHDPIFLSVFEDADLFRRFVLAGYRMVQSWDSLVYHLTCRGGQFLGAEKMEDFQKKDELWLKNNRLSMMEYIRKWGGYFKEYGPCEPRPNKKYNVGLKATNCTREILAFEPFFSEISVDIDVTPYIEHAQPNTKFDLSNKFVSALNTDVIVNIDCKQVSLKELEYVTMNFEDIMESVEANSSYEMSGTSLTLIVKDKRQIPVQVNLNETKDIDQKEKIAVNAMIM